MELIDRKRIANKALPKFGFGFTPSSLDDTLMQAQSFNHPSITQGVTTAAGAFKTELMAKNAVAKDLGGMPSDFTKAAPNGGAGRFLKNNAGGIANAAMSAIDFVGVIGDISKNKISSDEMMGTGGTMQQNVNGIGYTEERVDEAGVQRQIDETAKAGTTAAMGKGAALGGAVGTIFGPVGTGIGTLAGGIVGGIAGLFGSSKAKREAERQKRIAINRTLAANAQKRETAFTTGLRNEFNRTNVTDESQSLFHAEEGKEGAVNPMTMETYKKHIVNTAYGKMFAPQNAWVSDGEVIKSADGSLHRVKGGKNDTARAYLQTGDSVYSKKIINPETGNSVADDAASYAMAGQLDRLDMNLNVGRMMLYAGRRRGRMLPGYLGGTDFGNIASLANAYFTTAQRDARAEGGLRTPKSYVANPYEYDALQQLNSLHSDYYPVWALNRELEARGKSAIAQSGGLSAGQRMLGYMGLANKTQQNNAAALFEHQGRENALRTQAANAALQAGQNAATRQQQAYQWDEDMLAKAHAARENMLETSAYDRLNALTQFFKNAWEKNQFDRTMNLYETDQKMSEADREFYRNQFIKNNKPAAPTAPTLADKAASTVTAAGIASIHPSQVTPTSAVPTIKVQAPLPIVKPAAKRGKKATAGVKKSVVKGKPTTTSNPAGSPYVNAPTVETSASYVPYKFDNSAITDRYPNASNEAKLARPNKEKAGRPAPTSNAEALSRLWEKIKLGKREYERRYGKGN